MKLVVDIDGTICSQEQDYSKAKPFLERIAHLNKLYDEGYTIKCEDRRVYINAKTETGLFYGLQTLKQMLLQTNGKIPYTEIVDYPRFSYRGYHALSSRESLPFLVCQRRFLLSSTR